MLFQKINLLDEQLGVRGGQYVLTEGARITYIGKDAPEGYSGEVYDGRGRLLMSGFYNGHAHTPMTLMRGYGENLGLSDWLNNRIFPFEAKLTGEDVYWGTMLGIAESLRFGIVSSTDMYNFCEDMARAYLETGMKANIGRHVVAFDDKALKDQPSFIEAKAFYDGYNGEGDGRIIADFALHAEYTSTPAVVRQLADYAGSHGARVQVHVSETEAETEQCIQRHGKTPPQYLNDLGLFDVPATAAHCVWLRGEDFDLLKEKGVYVASCPVSNLKLASGTCNVPELMARGIPVSIGTDSVASNNSLNFFEEMKFFATVSKGVHRDPTVITPTEALGAATRIGAAAQGREDCGRLAVGMRADLICVDIARPNMHPVHDMVNNLVYSTSGADVRLTMVDGRVLYRDGEYLTMDIERVIYEAQRAADAVVARI